MTFLEIENNSFKTNWLSVEVYAINESTRFLRQLIHDIGMRLKAYAICHQIRRISDGFASFDSKDCLTSNQLNYESLTRSTESTTLLAREYVNKYDKTILLGHTNEEEKQVVSNCWMKWNKTLKQIHYVAFYQTNIEINKSVIIYRLIILYKNQLR